MNRFNSLIKVQHFDAQNSKNNKEKFPIIWNTCKIRKHFEKLTSKIQLINMLNAFPYIKQVHLSVSRLNQPQCCLTF